MPRPLFLAVLLLLIAPWAHAEAVTSAPVEGRVALVIGNAAYAGTPLKNPVNDARAMAAKLRGLGFEVIERHDLTQKQIGRTLSEFRSKLAPGGTALFFYAGHGLQVAGANYLPAVDADIGAEEDVPNQSVNVEQVLRVMEGGKSRVNLVFLDACRNNPYARSFRSAGEGLARVNAPSGTLIFYATRPGSVAADGNGENGLYTQNLLAAMDIPGLPVEQVQKRVAAGVRQDSKGRQEPWMEGLLDGDFYFLRGTAAVEPPAASGGDRALRPVVASLPTVPPQPRVKKPAPGTLQDCDVCPDMVAVPAGSFRMGSTDDETEKPPHDVRVAAFVLARTEVTQGQWRAVMGNNPSQHTTCGDDCPVEQVSWDEAQDYLAKLSAMTGRQYRLPSEAEWEYACRAGGQHKYCGSDNPNGIAWYDANSGNKPHPVAARQANAWGLYDMSGNVWEWVEDCWNGSHTGAPEDGSTRSEGECGARVLRGGSWSNAPADARAAGRGRAGTANRVSSSGFRPARAVAP